MDDEMSWARFDDKFPQDPDLDFVCDSAAALHVAATCWCASMETDGFVPKPRAACLKGGNNPQAVIDLLARGWWIDKGNYYLIRSYLKYNRSKAQCEADRAQSVKRTANSRNNGGSNTVTPTATTPVSNAVCNGVTDTVTDGVSNTAPSPIPIPIPNTHSQAQTHEDNMAAKPASKLKGTAFVAPSLPEVLERFQCLLPEAEEGYCRTLAEGFIAHHETRGWIMSNGKKMKDWKAACVTWKMNAPRFSQRPSAANAPRFKQTDGLIHRAASIQATLDRFKGGFA